jgi:hypothetical protein
MTAMVDDETGFARCAKVRTWTPVRRQLRWPVSDNLYDFFVADSMV